MCFGNKTTSTDTKTSTPNPLTQQMAGTQSNLVSNIINTPFQSYTGNQVANFSPQQGQSFGMAGDIARTGVQYTDPAQALIGNFAGAGPQSIGQQDIAGGMSPFMSNYVHMALAPQLEAQRQQFDTQNRGADSAAVGAGAFGNDAQAALFKSNLTQQQDIAQQGLIGNAYNAAFNTAIGGSAQQAAFNQQGQTTNANLAEQALQRQLGGATALEGLGTYNTNTGINQAELLNRYGAQQTAQGQAGLNAQYNQWLMAQQYPFQQAQLGNQTLGAMAGAMPASTTDTKSAPDNSGWAAAGGLLGSAAGSFLGPVGTSLGSAAGSWLGGQMGGTTSNADVHADAEGGETPPVGDQVLVGERGPEIYMPHDGGAPEAIGMSGPEVRTAAKPGTVIPNNELTKLQSKYSKKPPKKAGGISMAAFGGMVGSGLPSGGGFDGGPAAMGGAATNGAAMSGPAMNSPAMGGSAIGGPAAMGGPAPVPPMGVPAAPGMAGSVGTPSGAPIQPGSPMSQPGMTSAPPGVLSMPGAPSAFGGPPTMSGPPMAPPPPGLAAQLMGGLPPGMMGGSGLPSGGMMGGSGLPAGGPGPMPGPLPPPGQPGVGPGQPGVGPGPAGGPPGVAPGPPVSPGPPGGVPGAPGVAPGPPVMPGQPAPGAPGPALGPALGPAPGLPAKPGMPGQPMDMLGGRGMRGGRGMMGRPQGQQPVYGSGSPGMGIANQLGMGYHR